MSCCLAQTIYMFFLFSIAANWSFIVLHVQRFNLSIHGFTHSIEDNSIHRFIARVITLLLLYRVISGRFFFRSLSVYLIVQSIAIVSFYFMDKIWKGFLGFLGFFFFFFLSLKSMAPNKRQFDRPSSMHYWNIHWMFYFYAGVGKNEVAVVVDKMLKMPQDFHKVYLTRKSHQDNQ